MRSLVLVMALLSVSLPSLASDCPGLSEATDRLASAEDSGQAEFKLLLGKLLKKDQLLLSDVLKYTNEINGRGRLPELQSLRQSTATEAFRLMTNPDASCTEMIAASDRAASVVAEQWQVANAELRKDIAQAR